MDVVSRVSRPALSPLLRSVLSLLLSTPPSKPETWESTLDSSFLQPVLAYWSSASFDSIFSESHRPKGRTTGPGRKGKGGDSRDLTGTWGEAPAERASRCQAPVPSAEPGRPQQFPTWGFCPCLPPPHLKSRRRRGCWGEPGTGTAGGCEAPG